MNKICTDLEQSHKLLSLGLDPNTADMYIGNYVSKSGKVDGTNVCYYTRGTTFGAPEIIYAWSLTALLNIAPKYFSKENHQFVQSYSYDHIDGCYHFIYRDYQHGGRSKYISKNKDLFDAAFEMVCWLLENGYIKKVEK